MKYKYYVSAAVADGFIGLYYCVNYNLNTIEGIQKMQRAIEEDGYVNPVILFFKELKG